MLSATVTLVDVFYIDAVPAVHEGDDKTNKKAGILARFFAVF